MASVSLVSVNIERSKHLDVVVPFLKEHSPEITTIQECMERDIPLFEETLQAKCYFTPLCNFAERPEEKAGLYGQAIFSKHPVKKFRQHYYAGESEPLIVFTDDKEASVLRLAKAVSYIDIEKEGTEMRIATTHFTWSPRGEATALQEKDLDSLLNVLGTLDGFVLTGDFNAPRGRATWDKLASIYTDNIPAQYVSSIDPMHRAGELPYVVDGVFTTSEYGASDVLLHSGVSDHKAITATISIQ